MIMLMLVVSGAAVGPLLAGLLSAGGWDQVFYMLMTADFFALLVSALTTIYGGVITNTSRKSKCFIQLQKTMLYIDT